MLSQRPGLKRGPRELVQSLEEPSSGSGKRAEIRAFGGSGRSGRRGTVWPQRQQNPGALVRYANGKLGLAGEESCAGRVGRPSEGNRMRSVRFLGLVLLGLLSALPAQALTITNTDQDLRT